MTALLDVQNLTKDFPMRRGSIRAVEDVTFSVERGETLALIGESGCGKSTVGRMILRLTEPTRGNIRFDGEDITALDRADMRLRRRHMQMVFQDPYASLNPRLPVGVAVGEPLENFTDLDAEARRRRVADLFDHVGLAADALDKLPFEFSGGQRQRLGLARALALDPALIVADEPVSALDVSVQAQVLNLMMDLQRDRGIAYMFISHDLAVVRHIAARVAVMYLGRIVELADTDSLFARPRHPYTEALIAAAPVPNPRAPRRRLVLAGDVPSAAHPPSGCPFHPRCPLAIDRCRAESPIPRTIDGTRVACHRAEER